MKYIFHIKMLLVSGSIFLLSLHSHAQGNFVLGKIGNQIIDQHFIAAVQLLNPDFGFTPDKEAFQVRLFKNYIRAKARAEIVRTRPIYRSDEVKKQIELVRQLAEDKYLATLYEGPSVPSDITVTDAEARMYYDVHIVQFTQPGQYSYYKAIIIDSTKTSVSDVVTQLYQYATIIKENFKTGDKSIYYVTYEKDATLNASDPAYLILSKLKPKEYISVSNGGAGVMIYMLTARTPEVVEPFEKVKEQCVANVMNVKREQADQQFVISAQQKYPIVLQSPLFK